MSDQHHHQHEHGHAHARAGRPLHRDWRAWTVVIIMLAAIAMYLYSGDEMFGPRPKAQQPPPAASGK